MPAVQRRHLRPRFTVAAGFDAQGAGGVIIDDRAHEAVCLRAAGHRKSVHDLSARIKDPPVGVEGGPAFNERAMVVGPHPFEVGIKPISAIPNALAFAQFESARPPPMNRRRGQQLGVVEKNLPVHMPLAKANEIVRDIRRHTENKPVSLP